MAKTRAKKEKKVTLETIMWNCRVVLRNKCSKSANRDAVLTLVFLKFAGDKFEQRRQEIIKENGENCIFLEKASFYQAKNVFYLNETSHWTYIIMNARSDDITILLDQALADILEIDYKKEMKRIQAEMKLLLDEEKKSQKMLEKVFEGIGYGVKSK